MKRVARVLQSIAERSSFDGGVMKSDAAATRTETRSIGSFFMNEATLFIFCFLLNMLNMESSGNHKMHCREKQFYNKPLCSFNRGRKLYFL